MEEVQRITNDAIEQIKAGNMDQVWQKEKIIDLMQLKSEVESVLMILEAKKNEEIKVVEEKICEAKLGSLELLGKRVKDCMI